MCSLRCKPLRLLTLSSPMQVQTVNKYQGQQNDYILLSLVRTRAVGHLRDVRRLVVRFCYHEDVVKGYQGILHSSLSAQNSC